MKVTLTRLNQALNRRTANPTAKESSLEPTPDTPKDTTDIRRTPESKDISMLKRIGIGAAVGLASAVAGAVGGPAVGMAVGFGLGAVSGYCNVPKAPIYNKILGAVVGGGFASAGGIIGSAANVFAGGASTAIGAATGYWFDVAKNQVYDELGLQ